MRKGTPKAFLYAALLLSIGNAVATPYKFTNLYDSSGPFNGFGAPSLNNSGTVAFSASRDKGEQGILTGSGGLTTTIADTSGPFNGLSSPSLNNRGTVAFRASLDTGGAGIFTGSGGPITTIADSTSFEAGVPFQGLFSDPSLNDSGMVAFYFEMRSPDSPNIVGIYTGAGGPITTIVDTSTTNNDFFLGGTPSLNNSGTVAFPEDGDGIFIARGGTITNVTDNAFYSFFESPSLNDSGTVAFVAGVFLDAADILTDSGPFAFAPPPVCERQDVKGIFTSSGGPLTTIAHCFPFFTPLIPSLNNSGTVVFLAENLITGGAGIFTGPDLAADKVIGAGDTLFGSTVADLLMSIESLNDSGQIAFLYSLADGRTGIARADPITPAPEPGTLPLLIAALLGAVWGCDARANRRSYRQMLCFSELREAAIFCCSAVARTPSTNCTPRMTSASCSKPLSRRNDFSAHLASL